MGAILIERDYKGYFDRFALSPREFNEVFAEEITEGMPAPCDDPQTYTLRPLVHMWYKKVEVGSSFWETFFTDMTWGLSDTDIGNNNYAEVRIDLMNDLVSELPLIVRTDKMLDDEDFNDEHGTNYPVEEIGCDLY